MIEDLGSTVVGKLPKTFLPVTRSIRTIRIPGGATNGSAPKARGRGRPTRNSARSARPDAVAAALAVEAEKVKRNPKQQLQNKQAQEAEGEAAAPAGEA